MNIALILAGGVGSRFGADIPKQYCLIKGKPAIEYSLDACRLSRAVDKIIIVARGEYVHTLKEKYGVETVEGGKERNHSVKNGFDYIAGHYDCEKVMLVDANIPLVTEEMITKFFGILDEYDHVIPCQKITGSLERYDGAQALRDEYFLTLPPEGFRFKTIAPVFRENFYSTTTVHQLPPGATSYKCFDYPYNMRLTYAYDLKVAEVLLDECILRQKQETILERTKAWLSSIDGDAAQRWFESVPGYFDILRKRWGIRSHIINSQARCGIVYECVSDSYGNVIVKFNPPFLKRYKGEQYYYKMAGPAFMAELLDYDDEFSALLIRQVYPGLHVKFDPDDVKLRDFYDKVADSFIEADPALHPDLQTTMGNFEDNVSLAGAHSFEGEFRRKMERVSRALWDRFFQDSPKVLLHMDLHKRNILDANGIYRAIDCQGVIGPYEFEYTRRHIIDSKDEKPDGLQGYIDMFTFTKRYGVPERLNAALFIDWVYMMNEYVYAEHDNYQNAGWAVSMIKKLFYPNGEWQKEELPMPQLFA